MEVPPPTPDGDKVKHLLAEYKKKLGETVAERDAAIKERDKLKEGASTLLARCKMLDEANKTLNEEKKAIAATLSDTLVKLDEKNSSIESNFNLQLTIMLIICLCCRAFKRQY